MKKITVKQLGDLAKISVRTLHYYDQIGLLQPTEKSATGYRYYSQDDLLKLQQIMFFKELGLSLAEIQQILSKPGFDLKNALISHRAEILKRLKQFKKLLLTIDKTINNLTKNIMVSNEDMYQGFTSEQVKLYRKEVSDKWGEKSLHDSENRIRKMSPKKWDMVKAEGEKITRQLADLINEDPADILVQQCIANWHKYLENFYPVVEQRLRGLGRLYVEDQRFTAYYDKYCQGLAEFKNKAIQIYCDNGMKIIS